MSPHGRVRTCGRAWPKDSPSLKKVDIEQAWNSEYFKEIRLKMLRGEKPDNCKNCYYQESKNGNSKRLDSIKQYGLDVETNLDGSVDYPPIEVDVRVGNICNLKCVHCYTGTSSKWYEDKLLLDKYPNTVKFPLDNKWIDSDSQVWKYLKENIKYIKKINFLGGEPFASKQHNKFIDWCVENNYTDFELHYVTNGTLISPTYIDKLKKFDLSLMISLDDFGERSEFLRFPGKWSTIYENAKYLSENNVSRCMFNWTCYNLNIIRLKKLVEYVNIEFPNIEFKYSDYVTRPPHMSAQNLPRGFKEKVAKELKGLKSAQFYVDFMMDNDLWSEQKQVLLDYLNDLDNARNTNWRKILPEIAELYDR
jgi:MoaA/NifB/PqqE/SkfB family radical SAM enzyme